MARLFWTPPAPAVASLRLIGFFVVSFLFIGAVQAADFDVRKSVGCMCCDRWAEQLRGLGHQVMITPDENIVRLKQDLDIPRVLWSCHTAVVEGYVVEGHVPIVDIERMLQDRPEALGIAVAGMPMGSPGMETNGPAEPYQVILFRKDGSGEVYASY